MSLLWLDEATVNHEHTLENIDLVTSSGSVLSLPEHGLLGADGSRLEQHRLLGMRRTCDNGLLCSVLSVAVLLPGQW